MVLPSFGALLQEQRKAAGASQSDVARHLGFSVPYISDVERGHRYPLKEEDVVKLADLLRVDPHPLLMAAAVTRGAFRLSANVSPQHREVGAALTRRWHELTPEQLRAIAAALR